MLTALEQGVRGGRWHTLSDKVYALPTLRAAFARVKANRGAPGVDQVTVAMFDQRLDANLAALAAVLRDGTYRAQPIRRVWIPKGPRERRPLGIPTVRDRVVQTALRLVLEPIFDATFAPHSYGFRPQRSTKHALRRVVMLLQAGYRHVVDADLRAYFDSIPHAPLRERVQSKVSDRGVLALVDAFLQQPIFEGLQQWTVEDGTPQGAVISPLLANVYLDPLDHVVAAAGFEMVRYADDFVILCRTAEDAQQALTLVHRWTEAAGLQLHPEKTHLVDLQRSGSFDFLGTTSTVTVAGHGRRASRNSKTQCVRRHDARMGRASRSSLRTSIARSWAGLRTSNTVTARLRPSMRGSACACAACCANASATAVMGTGLRTHGVGPRPSLRRRACFPYRPPMRRIVSPL